ncbi:Pleiotropic drug resistance protein 3 [Vitis vinifera]|uniref:Pleiotropic drug resistance protein 3 n=1 Tax=Vitis vinifera TaxID=29760 RepID=A0A438IXW1_VITVI|nr:Pleiotropic drug resistance protein 3 [Vitis vinifera]
MIVGPTKALFMDEISTGLDSSTTFQIVTCLQKLTHITESSILVSLLQPAPETFDLFGDIILMAEGKIAYHGPRDNALEFLEHCGFRCSPRKGIADFLQEVVSKKDQAQYWYPKDQPFSYVSVDKFESIFKELDFMWEGNKLRSSLSLSIKLVLKKCFVIQYLLLEKMGSITPDKHTHTLHFELNFGRQGKSSLIPHSRTITHPESSLLDIRGEEMASHGMNQEPGRVQLEENMNSTMLTSS